MKDKRIGKVLFNKEFINKKVKSLAKKINKDYANKKQILIGILKGCFPFYSELFFNLTCKPTMDFMLVTSYAKGTKSSGDPNVLLNHKEDIRGRHVLIVEDLIDSGRTLAKLITMLLKEKPASLKIAILLNKKGNLQTRVKVDYCCLETDVNFVIGYGFDYKEEFRYLPYIASFKE
jgi:hypoxanthine phosphoribosyltransferase